MSGLTMRTIGRRIGLSLAACACVLSLSGLPAKAQEWPPGPINMIVPFPPGGLADVVCRIVAEQLAAHLGQPFVVLNQGGAGGTIGAAAAANATPDGNTVFCTSSSPMAFGPAMESSLSYDPVTSFEPAAYVGISPLALVVTPSVPVGTIEELIAYAKEHPGELNYASTGVGTGGHLGVELFLSMTGTEMVHIPYQGGGPALAAMGAGETQLYIGLVPTLLPLVDAGTLKVLATTGRTRSEAMPDVPTISESGVTGYELETWYMLLFPKNTPEDIIARLHEASRDVLAVDENRKVYLDRGMIPGYMEIDEIRPYIQSEIDRWSAVVKDAGVVRN